MLGMVAVCGKSFMAAWNASDRLFSADFFKEKIQVQTPKDYPFEIKATAVEGDVLKSLQ